MADTLHTLVYHTIPVLLYIYYYTKFCCCRSTIWA